MAETGTINLNVVEAVNGEVARRTAVQEAIVEVYEAAGVDGEPEDFDRVFRLMVRTGVMVGYEKLDRTPLHLVDGEGRVCVLADGALISVVGHEREDCSGLTQAIVESLCNQGVATSDAETVPNEEQRKLFLWMRFPEGENDPDNAPASEWMFGRWMVLAEEKGMMWRELTVGEVRELGESGPSRLEQLVMGRMGEMRQQRRVLEGAARWTVNHLAAIGVDVNADEVWRNWLGAVGREGEGSLVYGNWRMLRDGGLGFVRANGQSANGAGTVVGVRLRFAVAGEDGQMEEGIDLGSFRPEGGAELCDMYTALLASVNVDEGQERIDVVWRDGQRNNPEYREPEWMDEVPEDYQDWVRGRLRAYLEARFPTDGGGHYLTMTEAQDVFERVRMELILRRVAERIMGATEHLHGFDEQRRAAEVERVEEVLRQRLGVDTGYGQDRGEGQLFSFREYGEGGVYGVYGAGGSIDLQRLILESPSDPFSDGEEAGSPAEFCFSFEGTGVQVGVYPSESFNSEVQPLDHLSDVVMLNLLLDLGVEISGHSVDPRWHQDGWCMASNLSQGRMLFVAPMVDASVELLGGHLVVDEQEQMPERARRVYQYLRGKLGYCVLNDRLPVLDDERFGEIRAGADTPEDYRDVLNAEYNYTLMLEVRDLIVGNGALRERIEQLPDEVGPEGWVPEVDAEMLATLWAYGEAGMKVGSEEENARIEAVRYDETRVSIQVAVEIVGVKKGCRRMVLVCSRDDLSCNREAGWPDDMATELLVAYQSAAVALCTGLGKKSVDGQLRSDVGPEVVLALVDQQQEGRTVKSVFEVGESGRVEWLGFEYEGGQVAPERIEVGDEVIEKGFEFDNMGVSKRAEVLTWLRLRSKKGEQVFGGEEMGTVVAALDAESERTPSLVGQEIFEILEDPDDRIGLLCALAACNPAVAKNVVDQMLRRNGGRANELTEKILKAVADEGVATVPASGAMPILPSGEVAGLNVVTANQTGTYRVVGPHPETGKPGANSNLNVPSMIAQVFWRGDEGQMVCADSVYERVNNGDDGCYRYKRVERRSRVGAHNDFLFGKPVERRVFEQNNISRAIGYIRELVADAVRDYARKARREPVINGSQRRRRRRLNKWEELVLVAEMAGLGVDGVTVLDIEKRRVVIKDDSNAVARSAASFAEMAEKLSEVWAGPFVRYSGRPSRRGDYQRGPDEIVVDCSGNDRVV